MALLLLAFLPAGELPQHVRNPQALCDSLLGIVHAFERIAQKGQPGLGEGTEGEPLPHLREPVGKGLEVAAPVHFPGRDHLLDFGEIVGSGRSAPDDAGDRSAHAVSGQGRGFEHVACHPLGVAQAGVDPRHVELRARPLPRVADFAQIVEGLPRVGAPLFEQLRAQLEALRLASRGAREEEAEKLEEERHPPAGAAGEIHREPYVEESLANRVETRPPVPRVLHGAEVTGIREALQQRRGLLLAHPHSRRDGGRGLVLAAHARETLQQRALAGGEIVQPALVERRNPVEQHVKLLLHARDRLVGDQLVEHHREARVTPRHLIERFQSRPHIVQCLQNARAALPLEIPPDDLDRLLEAQALQDLDVEEVVERLSDIGDRVEVERRGGDQRAAVVSHEELAERSDVGPAADLPGQDLAQVLEHDEQGTAAPAILSADNGHQDVRDPRVVLFGLHRGEQLRPPRFVLEGLLQYPAHPDQEVGEGEGPVRLLRKPDDHDARTERFVGPDSVLDAREEVGLADAARADEEEVVLRLPAHRSAHRFDGVVDQVLTRDGGAAKALRAGHPGAVEADTRLSGQFRHGTSSTTT